MISCVVLRSVMVCVFYVIGEVQCYANATLCYPMLWYAVLCYMLSCVVMCCVVLCNVKFGQGRLCYVMPSYVV